MGNFAVCVVLYDPSEEEIQNINVFTENGEYVYIYDNSKDSHLDSIQLALKTNKFIYLYNGENDGISLSYNLVAQRAIREGFSCMLCVDQDSKFSKANFVTLKRVIHKYMGSDTSLMAVNTIYSTSDTSAKENEISAVDFAITSGSVLNLTVFDKLGGFDENIFIDGVDRDFCLTSKKRGFGMYRMNQVTFQHTLGNGKKNIFGVYSHSPLRNYYIFRNRLYIMKKHSSEFKISQKIRSSYLATLRQLLSVVFIENNKIMKLQMMLDGKHDYKKGNFGKR